MEHRPRTYKTLPGVLRGMGRSMIGEIMCETLLWESATFPLEIICVNNTLVKLIVSLDYVDGAAQPFVVRAWDWIGKGTAGQPGVVRGTLQIWAINASGEVIYRAVYPPERIEVE
jgi:hypothetical protein